MKVYSFQFINLAGEEDSFEFELNPSDNKRENLLDLLNTVLENKEECGIDHLIDVEIYDNAEPFDPDDEEDVDW